MLKVFGKEAEYLFENLDQDIDLIRIDERKYHLIKDGKSYNLEIEEADYKTKEFVIKVNGNSYSLKAKNRIDLLLADLGMESTAQMKTENLVAPMPGMVLDVLVEPGADTKKGAPLLILEAMKMENMIKAPEDLQVDRVLIEKGQVVEKGQEMITFK